MKKILSFLIAILMLSFWGCASSSAKMNSHNFDVDQLLSQLPAENEVQRDLVINALLSLDEKQLCTIATLLESQDAVVRTQAEYAWHGMALYVSQSKDLRRQKYISVTDESLKQKLSLKTRLFVLDQLKYIPDDQVVEITAHYLANVDLSATAVMVLQSIHTTEAAEALLAALAEIPDYQKPTIILALSEMQYRPAAEKIFNLLPANNPHLQLSALMALAGFGYLPAESLLRDFAKQDSMQCGLLLLFAKNLAANAEKTKSVTIFREILENKSAQFNEAQREAALTGLTDILNEKAFTDIINAFNDENKKIRITALNLAQQFNSADYMQKWIDIAGAMPVEQQTEIIDFLGRVKNPSAVPWLSEKCADDDILIQAAALQALARIPDSGIEQDVQNILKSNLQDELYSATQNILLQMQDSLLLDNIIEDYENYSLSGKKLIIIIIADRKKTPYSGLLIKQLATDNMELKGSALDGLAVLSAETQFKELLSFFLKEDSNELEKKYANAVIASFKTDAHTKYLLELFDTLPQQQQIKLLEIFRQLGGEKFFRKIYRLAENLNSEISPQAKENLLKWPDENALPYLIKTAGMDNDENRRIQAVRRAVLILKNSHLPKETIVKHCAALLDASPRADEKRLVLSVLADVKNKSALELLAGKLNDPDIGFNVFLALLSWTESNTKDITDNSAENLIVNLLKGRTSDSLQAQIARYIKDKFEATPPEGFMVLFNGLDLSGWKGLVANPLKRSQMTPDELQMAQQSADSIMHACWYVDDGMLCFNGDGFPNICTIKDFKDFELYVDWKIKDDGDSGIYLRGSPQVQIWDPAHNDVGSGGLYNNKNNISIPLQTADNPAGEWNTFHIIMKGQRVTVFLNNKLVTDNVILENYWERDKAIYSSGSIELQAHRNPLYFKNIFIKELPAEAALFEGSLFNGTDLSGWQVIDNLDSSWHVKDGILSCKGQGGGWLSTEKEYKNFELHLEFRLPEGGNSGVFIRAPQQGDPAYTGMEIQLLDDYSDKYSDLKAWQYTGSIYGLQAPEMRVSKKANEWQTMIITCQGPQISVILNNKNIIKANLADFGSSEKEHPGIKRRKGFIGLQNHSSPVEFRHIQVKELP